MPRSSMPEQPEGTGPKIREVFEWYESQELRELAPTAQTERRRVWKIFCEYQGAETVPYGDRPYTDFRPLHLLQCIKAQNGLRSAWTRKRWVAAIHSPMNAAARLGLIRYNPFWGLRMPMGREGRDWTDDEFQALLRNAPAHVRRVILFIRFSGARPGELRAAKWDDLKLDSNIILLRKHKTSAVTAAPRRIRLNHVTLKLLDWIKRNQTRRAYCGCRRGNRVLRFVTREWLTISEICARARSKGLDPGPWAARDYLHWASVNGLIERDRPSSGKGAWQKVGITKWRLADLPAEKPLSPFIFLNADCRPWANNALTKQIRQASARAGLSTEVKLHGGRHFFCDSRAHERPGRGHSRLFARAQEHLHDTKILSPNR